MARRKEQTERRRQLVAAATSAVLTHGSSGLRLADIAGEAGLTSASVLYYYPDVRELYTEVLAAATKAYCEDREARVAQEPNAQRQLAACLGSGVSWPGAPAEASRIAYELYPVVLRIPAAVQAHSEMIERQASLYARILTDGESQGAFTLSLRAEDLGRGLVALEDGLGIQVLNGIISPEQEYEWLRAWASGMVGAEIPAIASLTEAATYSATGIH